MFHVPRALFLCLRELRLEHRFSISQQTYCCSISYRKWENGIADITRSRLDRHPLGFTSCTCTQNLHPLQNGWKCHPCRIEAIIALDARIKDSIETMTRLRRTRIGDVIYDFEASQRGKMNYAKCPGCAVRLSAAYLRSLENWEQTAQYCLACDGVVVKATRGRRWVPTGLARGRPRRASVRIGKINGGKPPLRYARGNYRVVSDDPAAGHAV